MALTYISASAFVSGSQITAADTIKLANAFNSRLRGGAADPTRRIQLYVDHLYRSVRLPDVEGNYSSLGEWMMYYLNVEPEQACHWPLQEAGDYEGANTSNPAMQFVFGLRQGGDIVRDGEGDTLDNQYYAPLGSALTDYWYTGKYQRGGYDYSTGHIHAPMLEAAESHSMNYMPYWLRYEKAYGSYQPTWALNTDEVCTQDGVNIYNWVIKYKNINTAATASFPGTCHPDSGGTTDNVMYIYDFPSQWIVIQYNLSASYFPKDTWIEVKEGGGKLQRYPGNQVERLMINPYLLDFRGTDEQRAPSCIDITKIAFANQEFYQGQYLLSPAFGYTEGTDLMINYSQSSFPADTLIASGSVTDTITAHNNYELPAVLIQPIGLTGSCIVQQMTGSVVLRELAISESINRIETYPTSAIHHTYWRLLTDANFTASGTILFETAELYSMKPRLIDGYAMIRMSSANGIASETEMDTVGNTIETSQQISDNYFSYSCVVNDALGIRQNNIVANTNPVHESSRRFIQSFARVIPSNDLGDTDKKLIVGYETSCSLNTTQSILYIRRYQTGPADEQVDMWKYIVNNNNTSSNGIVVNPFTQSFSNEWLMFPCFLPYGPSDSSLWKKEQIAWYCSYFNRCHFYANPDNELGPNKNADLFLHFQDEWPGVYTPNKLYFPESVTGYTYAGHPPCNDPFLYAGNNPVGDDWKKHFYSSCRVYEPDYELASATVQQENGEDIVKLVFTGRFRHDETAPTLISRDTSTWSRFQLDNYLWRNDENAIMQFILQDDTNYNPKMKVGDHSVYSNVEYIADNPYGCVYPHLFFTKLIPRPYTPTTETSCSCIDGTGPLIKADTYLQMETYLKAISEGYIDETLSTTTGCSTDFDTAYDFTYENLIATASNDTFKSIPLLQSSIRPDKPYGFGPLANMDISAEQLNLMAKAVNHLTKVRLPLPHNLTCRYDYGSVYENLDPATGYYSTNTCIDKNVFTNYTPPTSAIDVTGTWDVCGTPEDGGSLSADTALHNEDCDGDNHIMETRKRVAAYSFALVDAMAVYALPEHLSASLVSDSGSGFFGSYTITTTTATKRLGTQEESWPYDCNKTAGAFWFDADTGNYWTWDETPVVLEGCGFFYKNGIIDAGDLPASDIGVGRCTYQGSDYDIGFKPTVTYNVVWKNTRDIILVIPNV